MLIDSNGSIQLIDFGLSSRYGNEEEEDDYLVGSTGTWDYMSPEQLLGAPFHGPSQDMWALGVMLWSLVYQEMPFGTPNDTIQADWSLEFETDKGMLI